MTTTDFADFAHLGATLRRAAAAKRVVGFDVFDTLVRRRVEPEVVKDRVAALLARRLSPGVDWRAVRAERAAIEQALYAERLRAGRDGEFTLREVVERWVARVVPAAETADGRLVDEVLACEYDVERRAQALTPGIAAVLEALAAAGKRLVFVSDMYVPARDLSSFLDALGIGHHFAAGYVSCDHDRRKTTGRLFELVLEREALAPADLLVVGNSRDADIEPAHRLGIATVHVVDRDEHRRRLRLQVADWAVQRGPFWAGRRIHEVVETIPARVRLDGSAHYDLGRTLAPAFEGFVLDVVERVQRERLREVYFLAREGWLLLRLYRRLVGALGLARTLPRGRYLFASRLATFLPSMARLDWPELYRMWRQYDRQSLRRVLENLALPVDEFAPLARRCGVADLDAMLDDPEHDPAFRRFLGDPEVSRRFTTHRDTARARLRAYLAQIGVPGPGAVAFVDVGWKGSIQLNICRAFADDPDFPFVHGLYLACSPVEAPVRGSVSGFLADARGPDQIVQAIFRTPTPFEMGAAAPHGSVGGYAQPSHRGGRVVPVLVEHEVEQGTAARLHEVRQGIEDHAADFTAALALFDVDARVLRLAALDRVLRYLRYPTRREASVFTDYAHVENFGVRGVTTFARRSGLLGALRAVRPRRVLREFWRRVDAEFWPELALRQARVPFGQALYDLRTTLRDVR